MPIPTGAITLFSSTVTRTLVVTGGGTNTDNMFELRDSHWVTIVALFIIWIVSHRHISLTSSLGHQ
jgi:hypothetical protein